MAAFKTGEDGKPIEFLGYRYAIARQAWEALNPNKTERKYDESVR
jgi:hypothetical protein